MAMYFGDERFVAISCWDLFCARRRMASALKQVLVLEILSSIVFLSEPTALAAGISPKWMVVTRGSSTEVIFPAFVSCSDAQLVHESRVRNAIRPRDAKNAYILSYGKNSKRLQKISRILAHRGYWGTG